MNIEMKDSQNNSDESKKTKKVMIIVTGREKNVEKDKISYEELIILQFGSYESNPDVEYSVTYSNGNQHKPKGVLEKGESIMVKDGMIFNVTKTNKS